MTKTVVALYDENDLASDTAQELIAQGFDHSAIQLVSSAPDAVTGDLARSLFQRGIPEPVADYYAEGVRRGSTLVIADVPDAAFEQVAATLRRRNPVDIEQRAAMWPAQDRVPYDPQTEPYMAEDIQREREFFQTHEKPPGGERGAAGASGHTAYDREQHESHREADDTMP